MSALEEGAIILFAVMIVKRPKKSCLTRREHAGAYFRCLTQDAPNSVCRAIVDGRVGNEEQEVDEYAGCTT